MKLEKEDFTKSVGSLKMVYGKKQEQVPRKVIRFSNQGNIDNLIKQFRRE